MSAKRARARRRAKALAWAHQRLTRAWLRDAAANGERADYDAFCHRYPWLYQRPRDAVFTSWSFYETVLPSTAVAAAEREVGA